MIVVTGANTGLGAEAARDFAKRGATVVLACRNAEKTEPFLTSVRKESGNTNVHFMHLDLASLSSVRRFADELTSAYPKIHSLVCNAGVWLPMERKIKTMDGFEVHVGTNHLGHFLLTSLLLDRLAASSPSRVVVVSSSLMDSGRVDLAAHDHFLEGRQAEGKHSHVPTGYSDSKLMNALFVKELAARTQGRGITAVCISPGWCKTELSREVGLPFIFLPIAAMFMRSAAQGAQNIIQAVVEDSQRLSSGGFYSECKLDMAKEARLGEMGELQLQLWQRSVELTGS